MTQDTVSDTTKKRKDKRSFCLLTLSIEVEKEDNDEAETVYEEISETENDSSVDESNEEVEYVYEIEYVEESEDSDDDENKQKAEKKQEQRPTISPTYRQKSEVNLTPILTRRPTSMRKSVSFSSVHSVLTENDEIIYVDENDDIFSS